MRATSVAAVYWILGSTFKNDCRLMASNRGDSPSDTNQTSDKRPTPNPRGFLRTFSSFRNRNYRLFWGGQLFSVTGTWVQRIALAWLVLELTDSSFLLGAVTALQFTPIMLLSLFGGVIADRMPKRPVLVAMQSLMAVQALMLGLLVWTDLIEVWHVFALSAVHGVAVAFDNPTRQAFVAEMVGKEQIANAVALNSSLFNSARIFGPAIGGGMIAAFGLAIPFFFNAFSFITVIIALLMIRASELHDVRRSGPGRMIDQFKDGMRFSFTTPPVAMVLIVMAFVGTFGYNFSLVLPLIARYVLETDALGFGGLTSAMAVGSVAAALAVAYISRPTEKMLMVGGATFSAFLLVIGISTFVPLTVAALVALGAASIVFTATANSRLQILAPPEMRGRVMGFYIFLFQGTAPFGNLFVGWLAEFWSVPGTIAVCALLCGVGIVGGLLYRLKHKVADDPKSGEYERRPNVAD
jgi:MFS family permease